MKAAKYCVSVIFFLLFFIVLVILNSAYIFGHEEKNRILIESASDTDSNVDFIIQKAEEYDLVISQSVSKNKNGNKASVVYYVSDNKHDAVVSENGIRAGVYKNPLIEEIDVSYKNMRFLPSSQNQNRYSIYNASAEKISEFCKALSSAGYSSVVYDPTPFYYNIIYFSPYLILVLSEIILLIITYVEVNSKKKELLIKYIHGEKYLQPVIISIISDVIFYTAVFLSGCIVLNRYTKVCGIYNKIYIVFFVFIILNTIVSLSVLKRKSKEIEYGHQYSPFIAGALKFLKSSGMILVFIFVSVVVIAAPEVNDYAILKSHLKDDMDSVFVSIDYSKFEFIHIRDPYKSKEVMYREIKEEEKFLYESDEILEPKYITDMTEFIQTGRKIVYCNYRAADYIKKLIPEFEDTDIKDYDCVFLFPKISASEDAQAAASDMTELYSTFEGFPPEKTKEIYYDSAVQIFSFSHIHEPVSHIFPYICIFGDTYNNEKFSPEKSNYYHLFGEAIYGSSEDTIKIYEQNGYSITCSSISEMLDQKYVFIERLIMIIRFSIILMLIFMTVILFSLVKLEYKINGMELAVKKILGYSVLKKHVSLYINALVSLIINLCLSCIFMIFFRANFMVLIYAFLLSILECLVLSFNIVSEEKKNLIKTLKGGAL